MFQVNDKVVCVDDTFATNPSLARQPKAWITNGTTYVVRGVSSTGGPLLVGIDGGQWHDGEEASWRGSRFRKLAEVKAENAAKRAEARNA